jgi:flagellar protein FlaG
MDTIVNSIKSQPASVTPFTTDKTQQSVNAASKAAVEAEFKAKAETKPAGEKELTQAVSKMNDYVQNINRDLQFSVDKVSGVMVVKVIETNTDKVIRQIPSEEMLRIARGIVEQDDDKALNIFSSKA